MTMYGTVSGPVDPRSARASGYFLKSFEMGQFADMLKYCGQTKLTMVKHGVTGELVFSKVNMWGRGRKHDTWQVFLMPEEWEEG